MAKLPGCLSVPALLLAGLLAACGEGGGDAADAGPTIGPANALFAVPGGASTSGFYALPYPNDIRVGDDGRIDLSDHPRPNAIIGEYVDVVAERQRGFSVNAASFLRFDAPIDPSSLPQTAEASRDEAAAVYLVDVDADSAHFGERTPVQLRFEHYAGEAIGTDWLSVLPYPGFPLQEQTTYAVVATTRLRATDGSPVGVAPDFATIAGSAQPSASELARAQEIYAPLWNWLDQPGGDQRDDVVSASVFTTQDATSLLGKVRDVVWTLDPPEPRDITWLGTYDDFVWYEGVYDAPNFQRGDVPYMRIDDGGDIVLDEDTGEPVIQRWEELRFAVSIPPGEMPEGGWPIVLYAHGTGGSYKTFRNNGTAKRLAAQGLAVIGIDQVLHGPRNPSASPEISFFNFQNPLAARYNTLQGALDNFQLLRLVLNFDYVERRPGGHTLRFDPDRVYFFGHSQGGLTGPPFLANEPLIKGAILSGAGGLLYLSMILKTKPIDISAIVGAFIRDWPLDRFNPVLALLQGWVDISDAVSYGPHLVRDPLPGMSPIPIFQSEGFVDSYTPLEDIEGLATAIGESQVGPVISDLEGLSLRGLEPLTAPVEDNLEGVTAVLMQYQMQAGSDGHFVVFEVPAAMEQSARFLGTLAETGTATLVVPTP